jgi:hypothetical protein
MLRGYLRYIRAVQVWERHASSWMVRLCKIRSRYCTVNVILPSRVIASCVTVVLLSSSACIGNEAKEGAPLFPQIQSSVITSKKIIVPKQDQDVEAKGIFEGDVDFKYVKQEGVLSFHSDKLIAYVLTQTQMLKRVEMFGEVSMQKGEWRIHSKEAFSDNLNAYVDFSGDVTVRKGQETIGVNLKRVRFNTLAETISSGN